MFTNEELKMMDIIQNINNIDFILDTSNETLDGNDKQELMVERENAYNELFNI